LLQPDQVLVVEAEVGWDDYAERARIRTQALYTLAQARQALVRGIEFRVAETEADRFMTQLESLLRADLEEGQGTSVWVHYQTAQAAGQVRLGRNHRIPLEDDTLHRLRQTFAEADYRFRYQE
jgi:DNA polymerase-3 subunit alpha